MDKAPCPAELCARSLSPLCKSCLNLWTILPTSIPSQQRPRHDHHPCRSSGSGILTVAAEARRCRLARHHPHNCFAAVLADEQLSPEQVLALRQLSPGQRWQVANRHRSIGNPLPSPNLLRSSTRGHRTGGEPGTARSFQNHPLRLGLEGRLLHPFVARRSESPSGKATEAIPLRTGLIPEG